MVFPAESGEFLLYRRHELLVLGALGMEGLVGKGLADGLPLGDETVGLGGEIGGGKALEDVVDSLLGGVQHVGSVETIVAQLVVHDFVGGEIMEHGIGCGYGRCHVEQLMYGK